MPGRDVEDVAGHDLGGLAVVHLDVEATLHQQLKMVDLARGRALDRLQGRRPAKARLERTFDRVQATGAEVVQEPMDQSYGRDCAFRDPAGNMIRIIQARG
jgi:hypothetical protein